MNSLTVDEDAQIRSVERTLIDRFSDVLPGERICSHVQQSRRHFEDAHVRSFIAALIQREATEELLRLRRRG